MLYGILTCVGVTGCIGATVILTTDNSKG